MSESTIDSKSVSVNKMLKIMPNDLLTKLNSRGFIINNELKNNIIDIEKNILKDNLEIKDLQKYNFVYDISEEVIKSFELFSKLKDYNINYKIYIFIFLSLDEKKIRNLYRYIQIKWLRIRNKHKNNSKNGDLPKEIDYKFPNIFDNKIYQNNKAQIILLDTLKLFADINKINIFFIVNVIQEYLCP